MLSDTIHIQNLELSVQVGVPDDELAIPQRLTISLTLVPLRDFSDLQDDIALTVDYFGLTRRVQQFARSAPRRLIETLAHETAEMLLAEYPLRSVTLELRKYILADTSHVAIRLRRERGQIFPGGSDLPF